MKVGFCSSIRLNILGEAVKVGFCSSIRLNILGEAVKVGFCSSIRLNILGGAVFIVLPLDQISSVKNPGDRFKVDANQGSITQLPPITFNDSVLNKLDKAPGDHDVLTRPSRSMKVAFFFF